MAARKAPPASARDPVDALSAAYTDPRTGQELTRELSREVLTTGPWATVMFLVQERVRGGEGFGPPRVSIRRYKRQGQAYRFHAALTLTSREQALKAARIMETWFADTGPGTVAADGTPHVHGPDSDDEPHA